jgi:hypothetical protein
MGHNSSSKPPHYLDMLPVAPGQESAGRMIVDLKQFTTPELLTGLSAFLACLKNETPDAEEQAAIYEVCAEIEERRTRDSRDWQAN